jgi:hypothetical protein
VNDASLTPFAKFTVPDFEWNSDSERLVLSFSIPRELAIGMDGKSSISVVLESQTDTNCEHLELRGPLGKASCIELGEEVQCIFDYTDKVDFDQVENYLVDNYEDDAALVKRIAVAHRFFEKPRGWFRFQIRRGRGT